MGAIVSKYAVLAMEIQMAMNNGNNAIESTTTAIKNADVLLAAHPEFVAALDKLGADKLATDIITARATVANADTRTTEIAAKIAGAVTDRQPVIDALLAETDPSVDALKAQVAAYAGDAAKLAAILAAKVDERASAKA